MGGTGLLNFCLSYSIWANYGSPRLLLFLVFLFFTLFLFILFCLSYSIWANYGSPRLLLLLLFNNFSTLVLLLHLGQLRQPAVVFLVFLFFTLFLFILFCLSTPLATIISSQRFVGGELGFGAGGILF
jgi:hypothetical protein